MLRDATYVDLQLQSTMGIQHANGTMKMYLPSRDTWSNFLEPTIEGKRLSHSRRVRRQATASRRKWRPRGQGHFMEGARILKVKVNLLGGQPSRSMGNIMVGLAEHKKYMFASRQKIRRSGRGSEGVQICLAEYRKHVSWSLTEK